MRIRNDYFRIRILLKVSGPTGSGTATLVPFPSIGQRWRSELLIQQMACVQIVFTNKDTANLVMEVFTKTYIVVKER
jgi:hypothetical protein